MKFLRLAILLLLPFLFAGSALPGQAVSRGKLTPATAPPASAEQVKIGFYPISIFQLDMGSHTYYVDAYVWLRWKGDIDPTEHLEFTNMVQEWDKQQESVAAAEKTLPDGSHYKFLRLEGRFVQPFSFADYPFDRQALTITAEDTLHDEGTLAYVIDTESSGIAANLEIPGWKITGWSGQAYSHDYGTRFGVEEMSTTYSAAQFAIHIQRPLSFFIWKLLMPLALVLLAGLSALLLDPHHIDARTALPIGALLTAIFLQKSYSDALPDVGYLVLMDKIFLLAYAMIVLMIIRVIIAYALVESGKTAGTGTQARTDRILLAAMIGGFGIATAAIVFFR